MGFAPKEVAGFFKFLDELRKRGSTNMYGAGPYLSGRFGMTRPESYEVLSAWMSTFDADKSPDERAVEAMAL